MEHKAAVLSVLTFALAAFLSCTQAAVAADLPVTCAIACLPPKVQIGCQCVDLTPFPICPRLDCPLRRILCAVYKKDANGCPTCQCQCSRLNRCPTGCLHGVEHGVDANGCPTCICKPRLVCPPVCAIACQYGNVLDANGCPTCRCKPRPIFECPPVCAIHCIYGNVLDKNGCPTCRCNPGPIKLLAEA